MIPFEPQHHSDGLINRIQDVVRRSFLLAQSAQDLAAALKGLFALASPGATTLTLGVLAPDTVTQTTPTHWLQQAAPDGTQVIVAAWRVSS